MEKFYKEKPKFSEKLRTFGEVGVVWNNSSEKTNASTQSSALDAFNAAMIVSK